MTYRRRYTSVFFRSLLKTTTANFHMLNTLSTLPRLKKLFPRVFSITHVRVDPEDSDTFATCDHFKFLTRRKEGRLLSLIYKELVPSLNSKLSPYFYYISLNYLHPNMFEILFQLPTWVYSILWGFIHITNIYFYYFC